MTAHENNFGFMINENSVKIPFFNENMFGERTSGSNFLKIC